MTPTPLARLLLDRFRWFDEALRAAQADQLGLDITSAQSLLFAELTLTGSRQADLARQIGVTRQAVNELVGGLERQGLVELVSDPTDRRAKLVRPTAEGKRSIDVALEVFAELESRLEHEIGVRRVADLREILIAEWGRSPMGLARDAAKDTPS